MKRREFIINSALAIGGTALLSGCGKKEIKKAQNQVVRRKLPKATHRLLRLAA